MLSSLDFALENGFDFNVTFNLLASLIQVVFDHSLLRGVHESK